MASVGPTLKVEGFSQYKEKMNELIQQGKTLDSEMKKVASTWDENTTAQQKAADKAKVLTERIENQKRQVEALRDMAAKAADQYGENSREAQAYKEKLNLAEAALNDLNKELDENQAELKQSAEKTDELGDETQEAGKKSETAGKMIEGLGKAAKTAAAVAAAAFAAVAAASVKLGKAVVSQYADYEQLVGGVETLYKSSSKKVQEYANNAYKTAGMSANQYMETVTSFSASLISSLGGDTEKAAKYADMAITDMSDNANKMGSDIQSIQNAYQGFAKGQYTLLDNLKLGYGGTRTEMERLLADAQAISGIEYNIDSYADVVDAIHVIQTSMGITGTTAKEAEKTISGSINALQASVKNLIAGLGDADGARGLAGGPEVGVGTVGQEDEGVVVANGTHATDEGVEAGCAEGECAQTIGLRGVGKGGEEEGVVGIGGEIVDLAVAACNDGVNSGTRKMEGCSVGISMPGEGDGGDGEVGKGEVGYEVGAGCGMDCVVERKAGTVEHGVGGEVEGHDTRD